MPGRIVSLLTLILLLGFCMCVSVEAAQEETLIDDYMDELDLRAVEDSIGEMFPDAHVSFREGIAELLKGELPLTWENLQELISTELFFEVANQRRTLVQILILAAAAAIFSNFIRIFEKSQISEIAFYMIYMILFVLLMQAFSDLNILTQEYLGQILHFMKVLLPVYLTVSALAAGSVTAVGFYELTLLLITGAQYVMTYLVLPGIRLYVLLLLLNHLSREDYLSKFAELLKTVLSWLLKSLLALVIGVQTIQGLILPAIDSLKNTVWTKAAGMVPVLGNTFHAVTETVLGTAVLLKNAVGVAGLLVVVLISLAPVVRLAVCTLLYKAAGAVVQPISDRRITECISGVGEGVGLLLKTISITAVMFLITLAMVTASVRGV